MRLNFSGIDKSSAEIATLPGIPTVFSWASTVFDLVANHRNKGKSMKNSAIKSKRLRFSEVPLFHHFLELTCRISPKDAII